MQIVIKVEVDPDADTTGSEVVWNVLDSVYHTPGVKSVVRMEFRADTGGGMWHPVEETRRPNERDV